MKPIQLVVLGLAFGLVPLASAQQRSARDANANVGTTPPSGPRVAHRPQKPVAETKSEPLATKATLTSARAVFQSADLNSNGKLDVKEAAAAGLGPRDCSAGDFDGDHLLDGDEFLVGYSGMLTRLDRPVDKDLSTEAARVATAAQAAAKTTPHVPTPLRTGAREVGQTPPAGAPASGTAPVIRTAPAKPSPDAATPVGEVAKSELERKIDEALRKSEPTPPAEGRFRLRERRPDEPVDPALAAKEALNRRLRNAEVTPEQAAGERAKLTQRIDNANGKSPQPATPATQPQAPSGGLDAAAKAAQADLERRLANTGVDAKVAEAARAQLEQRVGNAQNGAPGQTPATPAATDPSAKGGPALSRADAERKKLEQRVSTTGVSPEVADAARKDLEKRIDNASGGADVGAPASTPRAAPGTSDAASTKGSSPPTAEERAQALRDAVERRLKQTGADEKTAQEAREKVERRIKNAESAGGAGDAPRTSPTDATGAETTKSGATKPAANGPAKEPAAQPVQKPAARPAPQDARGTPAKPVERPTQDQRGGKPKRDGRN